jgi:phage tail sheath gpL-like
MNCSTSGIGFEAGPVILNNCDAFMGETSGRWSPYKQIYGHIFMCDAGTVSDLVTAGNLRNGPHVTVMGIPATLTPHPTWSWTGAICGRAAQHWIAPPEMSRPEQTLELVGILAPKNSADWPDIADRQALLMAGISTYTVDQDRTVRLDRLVTNYKTNDWGDLDGSWRDAITMYQIMYFTRSMRGAITGAFPRAALTDYDSGIPGFASPGQIKDVLIHNYRALKNIGLCENSKSLRVGDSRTQRDGRQPDRRQIGLTTHRCRWSSNLRFVINDII